MALILFGSSHTNNPLSSKECFYNNIDIVTSFGVATWDLVKHINNLSSADVTPSDWISTLVVATDMLNQEN